MSHTHREDGQPCPIRTKRECEDLVRQADHYHPGVPCKRSLKPGNSTETCELKAPRKAVYLAALSRRADGETLTFCLACEYGGPHHDREFHPAPIGG